MTTATVVNEKALAIAQDVLKNLGGQYVARAKVYAAEAKWNVPDEDIPTEGELQKALDKMKSCNVCALGACVLSKARLFNDLPITEMFYGGFFELDSEDAYREIEDVFGVTQRAMIESAFERSDMRSFEDDDHDDEVTEDEIEIAKAFGHRYNDAESRMRAIMENIVANGGVFVP